MDRFSFALTIVAIIALVVQAEHPLMRKQKSHSQNAASSKEDVVASTSSAETDTQKKPKYLVRSAKRKHDDEIMKISESGGVSPDTVAMEKSNSTDTDAAPPKTEVPQASLFKKAEVPKASLSQETVMNEDELLFQKLFPQEKDAEEEAKAGSVLEQAVKSFRVRVPVGLKTEKGTKQRYCLTEGFHDFTVRAEPCRKGFKNQKWYWEGQQLKNLYSSHRCLGLTTGAQLSQSLMRHGVDQASGMHLSMKFDCGDISAPLKWKIDDKGRLMSASNDGQCMAVKSWRENFNAMVLPCERKRTVFDVEAK